MRRLHIFFFLFLFSFSLFSGKDISFFRNDFEKIKDYKSGMIYLNTKISETSYRNAVTINSYKAVCKMMMAQYVYNPFTKYSWFNRGKDLLEQTILLNKNVENIYLRLIVQLNIPSFLSYTKDIESDTKFILENIDSANIPFAIKKYILKNLIETKEDRMNSLKTLAKKYDVI